MTALPVDAPAGLTITHLDEAWAVPCEAGLDHDDAMGCRGANPATLILWAVRCCEASPSHVLWCQPCTDVLLAQSTVYCVDCDQEFNPASTAVRLIEPLNRRTT